MHPTEARPLDSDTYSNHKAVTPPDDVRAYAHELILRLGPARGARELGVARQTAVSLALGCPVMPGSVALVRETMRARGVL